MKKTKLTQSIDGFDINKMGIKNLPGGWSLVPNISEMSLSKYKSDINGKRINIIKAKKREIRTEKYCNHKMNKYVSYQIKRLMKADSDKFGIIVWKLMEKSCSFLILMLNDTIPTGYKTIPQGKILKIVKEFKKLTKERNPDLDFKRVYIPKENEAIRKLGVPSVPYRIMLNGYNRFLLIFLRDKIHEDAHGFIPGKGTSSCGKSLINKLDYKYILETDLEKFFDNVDLDSLYKQISYDGMPNEELKFLINLNNRTPELPKTYKNEDGFIGGIKKLIKKIEEEDDDDIMMGEPTFRHKMDKHPITHTDEWKSELKNKSGIILKGTPQGASHSPICSIYTLNEFLQQQTSISYADDPIFFGNSPFEIKDNPKKGIIMKKSKTKGIKRNGELMGDFKYLGIKLTKEMTLENCTRNRKDFKITHEDRMKIIVNIFKDTTTYNPHESLKRVANSEIGGYLMASLYKGGYSRKYDQDFRLNPHPWSGLGILRKKMGNTYFLNNVSTANASSISAQLLSIALKK